MKQLISIAFAVLISCCSSKKMEKGGIKQETVYPNDTSVIPLCIQKKIDQFKSEEKQNPPRAVYRYLYKEKTVYYITPPCCDFFSELFDSNCNLIANPDGGFTGKGDGKLPDFFTARKNEKLIWKDERK